MIQLEVPLHNYREANITGTSACIMCGEPVFQYRGCKPTILCSKKLTKNKCFDQYSARHPRKKKYTNRYEEQNGKRIFKHYKRRAQSLRKFAIAALFLVEQERNPTPLTPEEAHNYVYLFASRNELTKALGRLQTRSV